MKKDLIDEIEKEAKKYFKKTSGCHDWSHIERVRKLALKIGKKEKGNLKVLEIATLLHDIGRKDEMKCKGKFCHAEKGSEIAGTILDKYDISAEDKKNILHAIISHRFRGRNIPKTVEAKILYDADKLDSIGAIGISRAIIWAGTSGSKNIYTGNEKEIASSGKDHSYTKEDSAILEYEIKLKKIKDKMLTKEGKKLAKGRHQFMEDFLKQMWLEVEGKR